MGFRVQDMIYNHNASTLDILCWWPWVLDRCGFSEPNSEKDPEALKHPNIQACIITNTILEVP